jgi:hypothetical protein
VFQLCCARILAQHSYAGSYCKQEAPFVRNIG